MAKRDDAELWRAALADVAPLRRRKPAPPAKPPPAPPPLAKKPVAAPPRPAPPPRAAPLAPITSLSAPGLDKASSERLKRGRYQIEARIDLHGMRQDDAHRLLGEFIARSARAEMRCVLVITGKGSRRIDAEGRTVVETGILRSAVPRWLNEAPNRGRILAFGEAQPRDGGGGALYILLRRKARPRDGAAGK